MAEKLTRREFVRDSAAAAAGIAAGWTAASTVHAGNPEKADTSKILNYKPQMEYRRCGRTGWMVSAVCLGGHWKRLNAVVPGLFQGRSWLSAKLDSKEFEQNRYDVVTRCIERGINYIDACTGQEVIMYAKAIKDRRDKMYLGYSWYQKESRFGNWRSTDQLKQSFDEGLKEAGLDYVDLWRITLHEGSSRHSNEEIESAVAALDWAKKSGRARATGFSSHDRPHIKWMLENFTDSLDAICTPYTAKTKVVEDRHGLWATMKKLDVGWFGIKPYASGSIFKGDGTPGNPHFEEDNEIARLTIRHVLCNPVITAPIPGMTCVEQVDNLALAVAERRELDQEEQAKLDRATDRAWANLPHHYQWLKDWEYV
jgi:aryl-alcohol dehydrogenase-like predicted oxidoreductase